MNRIGITLGDQAGISKEIIHSALSSNLLPKNEYRIIGKSVSIEKGKPSEESAKLSWEAMKESLSLWRKKEIDAIVTAPICKFQLQKIGFPYPGQTEFYAEETQSKEYTMCFYGKNLIIALVTTHIPLQEISNCLTEEKIFVSGKLLFDFLQKQNIPHPQIAVCGLNPHSGEEGFLGKEEKNFIQPAIKKLNNRFSKNFFGPFPSDTLFLREKREKYDAILAMYHDQALIPFKMLDFENGVNCTLGLPFPRTSPDHGPAYDIAGKQKANPQSLISAIQLASSLLEKEKEKMIEYS